ncbi:unnamed protein product [Closterium sp. Yama58-4]|nr:unnamed protein product [Closterium sp. Yama58-4]
MHIVERPYAARLNNSGGMGAGPRDAAIHGGSPQRLHFESNPELCDLDDPSYYMSLDHQPDRQILVQTSRIGAGVPVVEKVRWLDQQLSHLQSPYPIQHIEFTCSGDAVVQFISEAAKLKALARCGSLRWRSVEIASWPCAEEDVRALSWVGITGALPEIFPLVRQALQQYGEVKGECPPPPNNHLLLAQQQRRFPMLKYYFVPNGKKRLPPSIQIVRPDRPKAYPPCTVRLFTPFGPLSPTCSDFGKAHSVYGCPTCYFNCSQTQFGA